MNDTSMEAESEPQARQVKLRRGVPVRITTACVILIPDDSALRSAILHLLLPLEGRIIQATAEVKQKRRPPK